MLAINSSAVNTSSSTKPGIKRNLNKRLIRLQKVDSMNISNVEQPSLLHDSRSYEKLKADTTRPSMCDQRREFPIRNVINS